MLKADQDLARALTQEQQEQWEQEGYLVLRDVVPQERIDALRALLAQVVERFLQQLEQEGLIGDTGAGLPLETRFAQAAGRHANRFGRSWREQVSQQATYDLHRVAGLVAAIARITGTDVIGHPVYNVRPKLPGQQLTVVPWHQDSAYFGPDSQRSLIVTCWVPLVDVDESNGCLQVVAGSHRQGLAEHRKEAAEGQFLEAVPGAVDESRVVTCPMRRGDALLMHNLTFHRSLPTTVTSIRWSIDIRYVRAGDPLGRNGWADPNFTWVIRSATRPETTLEQWLRAANG